MSALGYVSVQPYATPKLLLAGIGALPDDQVRIGDACLEGACSALEIPFDVMLDTMSDAVVDAARGLPDHTIFLFQYLDPTSAPGDRNHDKSRGFTGCYVVGGEVVSVVRVSTMPVAPPLGTLDMETRAAHAGRGYATATLLAVMDYVPVDLSAQLYSPGGEAVARKVARHAGRLPNPRLTAVMGELMTGAATAPEVWPPAGAEVFMDPATRDRAAAAAKLWRFRQTALRAGH